MASAVLILLGISLALVPSISAMRSKHRAITELQQAFGRRHALVTGSMFVQLSDAVENLTHVVMETPKPGAMGLRAAIQNSSEATFRRPQVIFISFDDRTKIERSPHGVPVLRSMFQHAISQFPHADTYTYFNSDIAIDSSFVATANAVVKAAEAKTLRERFLVVGRRTNVNWTTSAKLNDVSFMQAFANGTLFTNNAQDYFMVSKNAFNWSSMPGFIVGHKGFDNWLVATATQDKDMSAVDATKTLKALHMTDEKLGNKEGFRPSSDGSEYNMRFIQRNKHTFWDCGVTSNTEWQTKMGGNGRIQLSRRKKYCYAGLQTDV